MRTMLAAIVLGFSTCMSPVVLGCPQGEGASHNPPGFHNPPGNSSVKDDSGMRCLPPVLARKETNRCAKPNYKKFAEEHPRLAERLKEKRHLRRDRHPADRWEDIGDKREDIKDRLEDMQDRREDIRDRRHHRGRLDRLEDLRDRREDIHDRREDIRDRLEDLGDRRKDAHDHLEDKKERQD